MAKKKITFDIDEAVYNEIKDFCKKRDIKLSDYWRDASSEKLSREKGTMTIFAGERGVEEFIIARDKYSINLYDATEELHELTKAVHEGDIRPRKSGVPIEDVIGSRGTSLNSLLRELPEDKSILFFTREKYENSKPQDWGDPE